MATHPATTFLKSDPVHIAGGMMLMAEHLLDTIDLRTACPERILEVAHQAQDLVADAKALDGYDRRQAEIYARTTRYERFALTKMEPAEVTR